VVVDALGGHVQQRRNLLGAAEGRLVGVVNLQPPLFVEPHDAGVRLEVALVLRRGVELVLDDDLGFAEASFDVALAPTGLRHGVGRVGKRHRQALVPSQAVVNDSGASLHGCPRVEDRRQLLVLDLDGHGCFLGRVGIVGGDGSDGLADEAHLAAGQHRHVLQRTAPQAVGDIVGSEDRMDAGDLASLGGVHAHETGVRHGAPRQLAPQHAGHVHVGAVGRLTGDFTDAIDSRRGRPDNRCWSAQTLYLLKIGWGRRPAPGPCPRINRWVDEFAFFDGPQRVHVP